MIPFRHLLRTIAFAVLYLLATGAGRLKSWTTPASAWSGRPMHPDIASPQDQARKIKPARSSPQDQGPRYRFALIERADSDVDGHIFEILESCGSHVGVTLQGLKI